MYSDKTTGGHMKKINLHCTFGGDCRNLHRADVGVCTHKFSGTTSFSSAFPRHSVFCLFFTPGAVFGLFAGCFLSNLLFGGLGIIDLVFGKFGNAYRRVAHIRTAKEKNPLIAIFFRPSLWTRLLWADTLSFFTLYKYTRVCYNGIYLFWGNFFGGLRARISALSRA
ncbi:MAG: QueT transporter family protein [Clostridiales bacterium]|nr:MAG: QueT transporter family protein [Clostridiales bacterium]